MNIELLTALDVCQDSGVLKSLNVISVLLALVKIIIPIILIVTGAINYGKAAISSDQDAIKNTSKTFIRNVFIGIAVFVIPSLITGILSIYSGYTEINNTFKSCNTCLDSSSDCKILIAAAEAREEAELKALKEEQTEEIAAADAANAERQAIINATMIELNNSNPRGSSSDSSIDTSGVNNPIGDGRLVLDWTDVTKISNITADELAEALTNSTYASGKPARFAPYAAELVAAERKYNVNVFYLLAIDALESGWYSSTISQQCNNLGGVKYSSSQTYGESEKHTTECPVGSSTWAGFDSIGGYIDYHAKLLGKYYLTEGASHYHGKTPEGVVTDYCPDGGQSYADTIKSIGNGLYYSATGGGS